MLNAYDDGNGPNNYPAWSSIRKHNDPGFREIPNHKGLQEY